MNLLLAALVVASPQRPHHDHLSPPLSSSLDKNDDVPHHAPKPRYNAHRFQNYQHGSHSDSQDRLRFDSLDESDKAARGHRAHELDKRLGRSEPSVLPGLKTNAVAKVTSYVMMKAKS